MAIHGNYRQSNLRPNKIRWRWKRSTKVIKSVRVPDFNGKRDGHFFYSHWILNSWEQTMVNNCITLKKYASKRPKSYELAQACFLSTEKKKKTTWQWVHCVREHTTSIGRGGHGGDHQSTTWRGYHVSSV